MTTRKLCIYMINYKFKSYCFWFFLNKSLSKNSATERNKIILLPKKGKRISMTSQSYILKIINFSNKNSSTNLLDIAKKNIVLSIKIMEGFSTKFKFQSHYL